MHLKRGNAEWQFCGDVHRWWPAGAHVDCMLGPRYRVIGSAVGVSKANGIGEPIAGSFEARLIAGKASSVFIPTHQARNLSPAEVLALRPRSDSTLNQSYFPLTAQSLTDFDWLAVLNAIA
jgi:hypothetical protein